MIKYDKNDVPCEEEQSKNPAWSKRHMSFRTHQVCFK